MKKQQMERIRFALTVTLPLQTCNGAINVCGNVVLDQIGPFPNINSDESVNNWRQTLLVLHS